MKLKIDFDNKIIEVEGSVNLGEFFDKLRKMLPNWFEFSLKNETKIEYYTYPVITYPTYPNTTPYYGSDPNVILCSTESRESISVDNFTVMSKKAEEFSSGFSYTSGTIIVEVNND